VLLPDKDPGPLCQLPTRSCDKSYRSGVSEKQLRRCNAILVFQQASTGPTCFVYSLCYGSNIWGVCPGPSVGDRYMRSPCLRTNANRNFRRPSLLLAITHQLSQHRKANRARCRSQDDAFRFRFLVRVAIHSWMFWVWVAVPHRTKCGPFSIQLPSR
jgi:hypothetical protein